MTERPVLACTDFSQTSLVAVERAAEIAERINAPLHILHVIDDAAVGAIRTPLPRSWRTSFTVGAAGRGDAFRKLGFSENLLDRLRRSREASRAERRYGKPYAEIIRTANKARARLVVVGVHKPRSAIERLLLGSTADRVLRASSQPVLVARRRDLRAYRAALVAVDLSDLTARQLTVLHRLLPDVRVTLLYVVGWGGDGARAPDARTSMSRMGKEAGFRKGLSCKVVTGDPRDQIIEAARKTKADLIVTGTRGRGGAGRLMLGSVAEHVIRAAPSDVLAVPPRAS